MYNPAAFMEERRDELDLFIQENPLGLLISSAEGRLSASHAPMLLDREKQTLQCHLARANEHWKQLDGAAEVLVVFTGANHYVSPSWYPSKAEHGMVVPTWNYSAVHAYGKPRCFEGDELKACLTKLTDGNEAAAGSGWHVSDAPEAYIDNLARAIVGVEVAITRIEGKWKLSQNRPEADRDGVVQGLDALGTSAALAVSRDMRRRQR